MEENPHPLPPLVYALSFLSLSSVDDISFKTYCIHIPILYFLILGTFQNFHGVSILYIEGDTNSSDEIFVQGIWARLG